MRNNKLLDRTYSFHSSPMSQSRKASQTNLVLPKATSNVRNRIIFTLVMILMFAAIIYIGHIGLLLLVVLLQTLVFKEVISIAHVPSKEMKLPWFRTLIWYFFISTLYFLYGARLQDYWDHPILREVHKNHRLKSYALYCIGMVLFVLNLKKKHIRFQFGQLAFTLVTLILVVWQSHFIVENIMEGMIWFVLPVSLVVCNDIMAYIVGKLFGRTPLISLSPKKTWEGFIGAFILTLIFSYFYSGFLAQFPLLTQPYNASSELVDSTFVKKTFDLLEIMNISLPGFLTSRYPWIGSFLRVSMRPIQFHAVMMAIFASIIAPFGGFFASGVKRAFKVKDFADSIPGHGGVTDRMDCNLLTGLFSHIYLFTFIKPKTVTLLQVANLVRRLTLEDQTKLMTMMKEMLNVK